MSPTISVVVPVYNTAKTLDRCIQSILNQTYSDYEILLIDDGSTDGSDKLCDAYAQQYDNILAFHKANEGLGPTRNLGIRKASGRYIYHCDSDDWIRKDLLEKCYKAMEQTDADICVFGYELYSETSGVMNQIGNIKLPAKMLLGKEMVHSFFVEQYFNSFSVLSACNRMYRHSFLLDNDLFFPDFRRCQDMAYSLALFDKVERAVILQESFYCYVIEPGVYKGRSYIEMLDTYMKIYNMTAVSFAAWDRYDQIVEQKLINSMCSHIANYTAHALAVKYRDNWKNCVRQLMENTEIRALFGQGQFCSRFLRVFSILLRLRQKTLMLCLSCLLQKKVKHSHG